MVKIQKTQKRVNSKNKISNFIKRLYLGLIFLFLYAPILVLIVYSFNASRSRGVWAGFTLDWYKKMFENEILMSALYYTIVVAIIAAIVSTIIGTIAAIGINNMSKWPRKMLLELNNIPVVNPDIVTGVSLMLLFIFSRLTLGFTTLLLAHITFCLPYVILSILPRLKQLNINIYEAALDLGAKPFYAIRKILIPQLMPGIVTGFLLAFTLSLDDFVVSFFTTGNGVSNLSIAIYSMARRGISPELNAISTLMFVTIILLMGIIAWRMERDSKKKNSDDVEDADNIKKLENIN